MFPPRRRSALQLARIESLEILVFQFGVAPSSGQSNRSLRPVSLPDQIDQRVLCCRGVWCTSLPILTVPNCAIQIAAKTGDHARRLFVEGGVAERMERVHGRVRLIPF